MVSILEETWPVSFDHALGTPTNGYRKFRLCVSSSCIEKETDINQMTVVFLHGAGPGDGVDSWLKLWSSLLLELPRGAEVLIPSGPLVQPPFSKLNPSPLPGWVNLANLPDDTSKGFVVDDIVFSGIDDVSAAIQELMLAERAKDRHVVVGGFSQGGAMALWASLSRPASIDLAGVFCLSGYLPQPSKLRLRCSRSLPVLLLHGSSDSVIHASVGTSSLEAMRSNGLNNVEMRTYAGLQHSVSRDELQYLRSWLSTLPVHSSIAEASTNASRL